MLNAIIIEDELHGREGLKSMLRDYCPHVSVVAEAASIEDGQLAIDRQPPDVVFLDVALPLGTGFDVLEQVRHRAFDVIFTTAYEHYALKAIKFSAIDYLLKPIDPEELQQAVTKVTQKQQCCSTDPRINVLLDNLHHQNREQHTITLATQEGLIFVTIEDIVRLEAMGAYTQFILRDGGKIIMSKHLKEYERLLQDYPFVRIHQSHLVNLRQVARYIKSEGGYVLLKDQTRLRVASNRRDHFLTSMQK